MLYLMLLIIFLCKFSESTILECSSTRFCHGNRFHCECQAVNVLRWTVTLPGGTPCMKRYNSVNAADAVDTRMTLDTCQASVILTSLTMNNFTSSLDIFNLTNQTTVSCEGSGGIKTLILNTTTKASPSFPVNLKLSSLNGTSARLLLDPPPLDSIPVASYQITVNLSEDILVRLQWDPPLDNGGAPITGYQIFVDSEDVLASNDTDATIILNSTGEYFIQIRAVNCIGVGPNLSVSITITGPCANSSLPVGLIIVSVERDFLAFQCEEGLVPQETVMATCQPDGTWNPNPLNYSCDSHTTTEDIGASESNTTMIISSDNNTSTLSVPNHLEMWQIIVIAVCCFAVVIFCFAIGVTLTVIGRKSVKNKHFKRDDGLSQSGDGEYNHITFDIPQQNNQPHRSNAALDTSSEYSILRAEDISNGSRPPRRTTDYDYCTVPNQLTSNNNELSLRYAEVKSNSSKEKETTFSASVSRTPVEYAAVITKKRPSGNQVSVDAAEKKTKKHPSGNQVSEAPVEYAAIKKAKKDPSDLLLNLDTILIQLRDISSKWLELGTAFELSHDLLHSIRTKCDGKDFDCLIEVCEAWLRSFRDTQSHPTWKAVSKALNRIGCNQLSKELSEIYITGELPQRKCDVVEGPGTTYDDILLVGATVNNDESLPPPIPPKLFDYDDS